MSWLKLAGGYLLCLIAIVAGGVIVCLGMRGIDLAVSSKLHADAPAPREARTTVVMPAACAVRRVYIDEGDSSGCASDFNSCQSSVCGPGGSGPCKTLKEWNHRCEEWLEEGTCVTLMSVGVNGSGSHNVNIMGPHATCGSDGSIESEPIPGTNI